MESSSSSPTLSSSSGSSASSTLSSSPSSSSAESSPTSTTSSSESSYLRNKYSLAFKKKVLSFLEDNPRSINKCAQKFDIDRKLVSRWNQRKTQIFDTKLKRLRYKCEQSGQRCHYMALEKQLAEWMCCIINLVKW